MLVPDSTASGEGSKTALISTCGGNIQPVDGYKRRKVIRNDRYKHKEANEGAA